MPSITASYDLVPRILPYLDRLLIFALLEHLSEQKLYPADALLQAKYDVMKDTNMTDYVSETYKSIHGADATVPDEITERRKVVLEKLDEFEKKAEKVLEIVRNPEVVNALRSDRAQNFTYVKENYGVTTEMVNTLYHYGQFQYNCGKYAEAAELLYHFRTLSNDSELVISATWGKLAAEIMTLQWENAVAELVKLKELIDQKTFADPLVQLNHRTWIIHWALFFFFNAESGRENLADLFLSSAYLNAIQTSCPWVLRYVTVTVLTSRNARKTSAGRSSTYATYQKQIRELVRVIKQERYEYSDPVTEFVYALYVDFDFEAAQAKLAESADVVKTDPFLDGSADEFLESARHLVSELYCQIHQRIDIRDLSTRLNLSAEEGEKWIVNLIRDTRVDAKIDFSEGTVIMNHPPQSVYQQVIERTKGLSFRTNQVLAHMLTTRNATATVNGEEGGEAQE
ncbi:eIF3 subunit 6 N terminal domain-containing protein [Lipomyces tetrasporus]|uniref:Eukaryotic translation initiation factor 3 subunit E n=1 Tax=Lipomyces tetrasporus TaxID=54092 RepID=A0AAD7QUX1_9ASCO|nr:eIF3 subunit 6 N terminal domain-containing protein [Lipomyces tetrasporus]KAJ8101733.1 eIF3 subunit 6 N terminal domain-containing protein [Lipomyces tetrasporus]